MCLLLECRKEHFMKKKIIAIVLVAFTVAFSLSASAEEGVSRVNEEMTELMRSQLTEKELEALNDISLYKKPESKDAIAGIPILRRYSGIPWSYSNDPIDVVLARIEQKDISDSGDYKKKYLVFGEELKSIYMTVDKTDLSVTNISVAGIPSGLPIVDDAVFIKELCSMSRDTTILGVSCRVERVELFSEMYNGAAIYLITDQGTFVKYYKDSKSSPRVFTEEEFGIYGVAYDQRLKELNPPGDATGGFITFDAFLKEEFPNGIPKDEENGEVGETGETGETGNNTSTNENNDINTDSNSNTNADPNTNASPNTDNNTSNEKGGEDDSQGGLKVWHWAMIAVGGFAAVAFAGGFAVYLIKKKK